MSAIDLTILKVLVGGILAVATFAGAVLPRVLKSYDPSATSKWMPLGNCFSGGLLLGAGLLHFFTEAAATLADVSGQTDCGDAATAALKLSTAWLLGGIFASLFIDRVLLRSAMLSSAAAALHGHSHDSSERSPSTSDAGDEQQQSDGPLVRLAPQRSSSLCCSVSTPHWKASRSPMNRAGRRCVTASFP
jgi:zinc transporter ZupT